MGKRLKMEIRGAVQGVGFRPFVYRLATGLGLSGWVLNDIRGVFLEVEGDPEPLVAEIKTAPWIKTYSRHEDTLNLTMEKGERRIPELVMMAQRRGVTVASVQLRRPSLEDVFLHFTGRTIREQEASADERNRAKIPGHGMGRRR